MVGGRKMSGYGVVVVEISRLHLYFTSQNLTFVGVSGTGDEEKGETHLLPKQLLSSSMSS